MAKCPNCGANVGFSKVCPHCKTVIVSNAPKQTSNIDKIKQVTSDFTQKPTCSDAEFKEMVVKFLANASASEKSLYEARIKAYSQNYKDGGNGIVNNPFKNEYARSEGEASSFSSGGTAVSTPVSSSSGGYHKKSGGPSKKKTIILVCAILGGAVTIGCAVGIPLVFGTTQQKKASNIITINLNKMGGSGGISSISATPGSYMPDIPFYSLPTKSGYDFAGYYSSPLGGIEYIDKDGKGVGYCDLSYYSDLYAHWEQETITINLNKNGGSGGLSLISATPGSYMPDIPSYNLPTRSGYNFTGYYSSQTGGTKYIDESGYGCAYCDLSANSYLYAHWEQEAITIYLNKNGGSGGISSISATPGSYMPDIPSYNLPTRSGYKFTGYYSSQTGGTQYINEYGYGCAYCYLSANSYLYAHWEQETITIYLNKNGGSGGISSISATPGSYMPDIPSYNLPTRSGYNFTGYYSSQTGGTKYIDEYGYGCAYCNLSANSYLYAHWQTSSSITYNAVNTGSYGFTQYSDYYQSNNYHKQNSIAEITFTFYGYGTVQYQYRVSSESGCDLLYIYHNSTTKVSGVSGDGSWTSQSISVSNGDTLRVRYQKDGSVDYNDDRAYFKFTNI